MNRCLHAALGVVLASSFAINAAGAQKRASEVSLKSAFLYKFTHFAEWPPEAMGNGKNPIVMCVIGRDSLAEVLEDSVQGRTSGGRLLVVRRVGGAEEARACHVLFIGWSDGEKIDQVIGSLAEQPILTVGDVEGFGQRGGMINLRKQGSRLRLEINRRAADRAGINLSSQLLKLANLVADEGSGEE
jgi:hypothetical protein